jgi:predicted Na+-dependent transporter
MEGEFFKELGPIFAGCLLPLFLGAFLRRAWSRRTKFLVTLAASALVGALATLLSGEFRESWAFVLLDMVEVFVASQVVYFLAYRPLRNRRRVRAAMAAHGSTTERA